MGLGSQDLGVSCRTVRVAEACICMDWLARLLVCTFGTAKWTTLQGECRAGNQMGEEKRAHVARKPADQEPKAAQRTWLLLQVRY
ncbi:hypothetical protein BM1_03784 [Bipolaris maydis]|nr:hypothetical protein BM1_03784 [Bipolaris maydis]